MSTSTSTYQTQVLSLLEKILEKVSVPSSASSSKSAKTSEKKARKPRKADAKENPWITFTTQVRGWLKEGIAEGSVPEGAAGIQCQQFCKFLKETHGDETYSLEKEQVLAAHGNWTPPESSKKPKPAPAAAAASSKPKPAKAAAKKALEKAFAEGDLDDEAGGATLEQIQAAVKLMKKTKTAPKKEAEPEESDKIIRLSGGKPHVWNTKTNKIYRANEDKSRGEYLGVFDPATKKIDDSVPE
jgi:hypothetical protein